MKNKIALILAAMLAVASLGSCGMRDAADKNTADATKSTAQVTSESVEVVPEIAEPKVTAEEASTPSGENTADTASAPAETEPAGTETLPPETEATTANPEPPVTEPAETEPVETEPPETEPACVETTPTVSEPPAGLTQIDGITYVNGILVVNKTYSLPADYNPGPDPSAENALALMFRDAAAEGLSLWVRSGVRTYNDQKWQYNVYVERDGQALADTYSARPGHSEHQSGLGFDINSIYKSFADTAEGQWLAANCHKYGFIIRYPAGKEHITGYMYEPWHVRYLGVDVATAVYESGLCLEEYLGITSAYTY